MSKAIDIFEEMIECNQLDYGDEDSKCELIYKELVLAEKMKYKMERWLELLESDGINSKNMVATDIQQLLEEIEK